MRHLRSDYSGIQDITGQVKILNDEPVFILRAKDPDAAQVVRVWAAYVYNRGGEIALVRAAQWWADEMERYAGEHFETRHVADVDEKHLQAPHGVMHPTTGGDVVGKIPTNIVWDSLT